MCRINRAENVCWNQLRTIRKARILTIAVHECSRNYIIQSYPAAKHAGVCMQLSLQNIPENKRVSGSLAEIEYSEMYLFLNK